MSTTILPLYLLYFPSLVFLFYNLLNPVSVVVHMHGVYIHGSLENLSWVKPSEKTDFVSSSAHLYQQLLK